MRSYTVLETLADCKVEDVQGQEPSFYNLNTVNNLHSFIKGRYIFYRGAATKYLNRYNALFQIAYRSIESKITLLVEKRMHYEYSHSKGHRYTQFAGGIDDTIFTNPFLTNTKIIS